MCLMMPLHVKEFHQPYPVPSHTPALPVTHMQWKMERWTFSICPRFHPPALADEDTYPSLIHSPAAFLRPTTSCSNTRNHEGQAASSKCAMCGPKEGLHSRLSQRAQAWKKVDMQREWAMRQHALTACHTAAWAVSIA